MREVFIVGTRAVFTGDVNCVGCALLSSLISREKFPPPSIAFRFETQTNVVLISPIFPRFTQSLNSHWLLTFPSDLIGWFVSFDIDFTPLNRKALYVLS